MNSISRLVAVPAAFVALLCVDVGREAPFQLRFVPEAQALIGRPLTPVSVAGVARRTAYRTTVVVATTSHSGAAASASASAAAASASAASASASAAAAQAAASKPPAPPPAGGAPAVGTIVTTLPPGCAQTDLNGVAYQRCGSTYYRATYMGPNLVFVVQQP